MKITKELLQELHTQGLYLLNEKPPKGMVPAKNVQYFWGDKRIKISEVK